MNAIKNKALTLGSLSLLRVTVPACASFFLATSSFCFCPQPIPTVACEFLNSDEVFVGKVTSARTVPPRGDELDGWQYQLSVQESFRGPQAKVVAVFTENSGGRFPLEAGKQYLIFADKVNGRLTITNCGNSVLLSKAETAIRELRGLQVPDDAVIEGRISFSSIPDSGTHPARVQVILRSGQRTFKITSDRNGRFQLHVPPGKYSAEVPHIPHWDISL